MRRIVAIGGVTITAAMAVVLIQPSVSEPEAPSDPVAERKPRAVEEGDRHRERRNLPNEGDEASEPATPRAPRDLQIGMKGRDVKAMQVRLAKLTYDPGPADGSFGYMTQHAVFAFEKVKGLERDGVISTREARVIQRSTRPPAGGLGSDYIDVDITRQVLFEVIDGRVAHTISISTANGETYRSKSGLATAVTPRGEFEIYSKTTGWRTSYLGSLYSPSYFYGGYAIHGSASVPPYPASHGCVRIPMHSADDFFARNSVGTRVIVHD